MQLFNVQIQLSDDNRGRNQYQTFNDATYAEAKQFVDAWNNSGYNKPNGYNNLVLHSITGGIYSVSPHNVFGIKVTPQNSVPDNAPESENTVEPQEWEFKLTYEKGRPPNESAWCLIQEQEIGWKGMPRIVKVSFRPAK